MGMELNTSDHYHDVSFRPKAFTIFNSFISSYFVKSHLQA